MREIQEAVLRNEDIGDGGDLRGGLGTRIMAMREIQAAVLWEEEKGHGEDPGGGFKR